MVNRVTGHVFKDGRMQKMTVEFSDVEPKYIPGITSAESVMGTLIPSFINAHTHLTDCFVSGDPGGGISEIFGPGGYKHNEVSRVDGHVLKKWMKEAMASMAQLGVSHFIDFRDGGLRTADIYEYIEGIHVTALGRPENLSDAEYMLMRNSGVTVSSISDVDYEFASKLSEMARKEHKMFALHFSERIREDIDKILSLKPTFLVHGIEATDEDLSKVREAGIPIAITPRSNFFMGKRPDYSRFIKSGVDLMLGSDNCMFVEPDIFTEMAFLYSYQRSINPIPADKILNIATSLPKGLEQEVIKKDTRGYIFFPEKKLTPLQIVLKGRMFSRAVIRRVDNSRDFKF